MENINVIRSRRRTLAIEVTADCRVNVRAPMHMPKAEIEAFVREKADWINGALTRQRRRQQQRPAEPTAEEAARLMAAAEAFIPRRAAYWAERMGLCPTGVRITGAKKRFGSCSAQNSLCFSWRLMLYPPEAIDYVVVHELAHIVHKNHGPAFYALIEQYLSDHRARRALLK